MKLWWLLLLIPLVLSQGYKEEFDISVDDVVFCPKDDCVHTLTNFIESANESLYCAFYDIDNLEIIEALVSKSKSIDVSVITDISNDVGYFRKIKSDGLMHHKFCIKDNNYVLTGSYNPTIRGSYFNNNNIILLSGQQSYLAYHNEFLFLNGKGKSKSNNLIAFNRDIYDLLYSTLNSANKSIKVAAFTFTDPEIADLLIEKNKSGLLVDVIFEKGQNSKWSQYDRFLEGAQLDYNSANMHHKFFIIDDSIVVSGSYNPTRNARYKNHENVVIIHNQSIVNKFILEFNHLKNNYQFDDLDISLIRIDGLSLFMQYDLNGEVIVNSTLINNKTRIFFDDVYFNIEPKANYIMIKDMHNREIKRISKKSFLELSLQEYS